MASLFQRRILPGLAFKAAVIGGGYATGRELAAFFLPNGMRGGMYGMFMVMPIWSLICALTFLLAYRLQAFNYQSFFRNLLGSLSWLFEVGLVLAVLVILAVFAAAAGEIGAALLGYPQIVGELVLVGVMIACASAGSPGAESLFKWASVILYGVFAALLVLLLARFNDRIALAFSTPSRGLSWVVGAISYAGYNIIGAVVVLPVARHFTSDRDALVAGAIAGPLAMFPAMLFFIGMGAFYPEIQRAPLPSDLLLRELHLPWFRVTFQVMIFVALLESGVSGLHAINERIAHVAKNRFGVGLSARARFVVSSATLFIAVVIAARVGLIALVANGYRWLSYLFILVYVVPLLIHGSIIVARGNRRVSTSVPS